MKAVRWTSGDKPGLELHDETVPTPGRHEVLVRERIESGNHVGKVVIDVAH